MHNMFLEEDISILMFLRLDKSKKKIKKYIYLQQGDSNMNRTIRR
jgi:hypothetical protein